MSGEAGGKRVDAGASFTGEEFRSRTVRLGRDRRGVSFDLQAEVGLSGHVGSQQQDGPPPSDLLLGGLVW